MKSALATGLLGASIAEKQVALGLEVGAMTEPMMQRYAQDLFANMCREIDCEAIGAGGNTAMKSSRR